MKITYHTSHSFESEGKIHSFMTQLYDIGVYGILNNDPSMQGNYTPSQIASMEKSLIKNEKNGKIKNLSFGQSITVDDSTGFWKKVEEISSTNSKIVMAKNIIEKILNNKTV